MKLPPSAFARAAKSVKVECATCGKVPELLTVESSLFTDGEYELFYRCHGAMERRTLDVRNWEHQPIQWPRRLFLRNWASHGGMSADARRERRMLSG